MAGGVSVVLVTSPELIQLSLMGQVVEIVDES